MTMATKFLTCIRCDNKKPKGKFAKDKFHPTGRNPICKMCNDIFSDLRTNYTGTTPILELAKAASKEAWKNWKLGINGY
jgi:hypothetical protein